MSWHVSDHLEPTASDTDASQPIPELLRLGEQLARARALAGVSADDLAQRLHINPTQLKALEEGDRALLPEGVFVVAMARRVAGALHADLEEAITAVRHSRLMGRGAPLRPASSQVPRPSPPSQPLPQPSIAAAVAPGAPSRPPLPWRSTLAAVLAACGMGTWLLFHRSAPPRPSPPSAPSPAPTGQAPAPARGTAPTPSSAPSRTTSWQAGATLRLRASEPSWVEVRDVRGVTLFNGTLTGEKRFPVGRGLEVLAGRPYAVSAAIGAGPATPLGGVADIRWQRFSWKGPQPEAPPSSAP